MANVLYDVDCCGPFAGAGATSLTIAASATVLVSLAVYAPGDGASAPPP